MLTVSLGRERCPKPLWSLGLDRKRIARPDHTVGSGDSEDGYNCNLELVGQFVGEGAKSQGGPAYSDQCAYYDTDNNPLKERRGVVVIDASGLPGATVVHVPG